MRGLLLDTHALLWWLNGEGMGAEVMNEISNPSTVVAVSAASVWEAGIKAGLGKLEVPESLVAVAVEEGFELLAVSLHHAEAAAALPQHHRDPFDRMLIAQAQIERLGLVTRDPAFDAYDIEVVRC